MARPLPRTSYAENVNRREKNPKAVTVEWNSDFDYANKQKKSEIRK